MNLDIDRVIELIFPHKCEFLYGLGLDGTFVCFCCSSLNQSPSEPNDINRHSYPQADSLRLHLTLTLWVQCIVHLRSTFLFFTKQTYMQLCCLICFWAL